MSLPSLSASRRRLVAWPMLLLVTGCAGGGASYLQPHGYGSNYATRQVERPREAVWNDSLAEFRRQAWVIDALDKASGSLTLSYKGDPRDYIDCGRIVSGERDERGRQKFNFPAASARQGYEVADKTGIWRVERKLSAEGRVNLVFEEAGAGRTKVSATTVYMLHRELAVSNSARASPEVSTESIQLTGGRAVTFPGAELGAIVACIATGKLEREILLLVK